MAGEPGPLEVLEEMLPLQDRDVLDVGCGEGALVRRLACAGARAVGIDPLSGALERARAAAGVPGARFLAGVAEDLPFADESFDAVIFFNSLHHVAAGSLDAALAEAARVLRPGGDLYVQEPAPSGSAFELLRPVNDETEVRRAAQEALRRASEGAFSSIARRELLVHVRHTNLDALREHMVSVDPARGAVFDQHAGALQERFEVLGRPVDGGCEFDQKLLIELLRR